MSELEVTIEEISPEVAKKYLDNNCVNRNISKSRVRCFASDMANNKWQLNGEGIQFNKAGVLINGQHRLSAVIESGKTIKFVVIRNIDNDISIYDRGKVRSVTDSLIISGMEKTLASNDLVAVAKLHYYVQYNIDVVADSEVSVFLKNNSENLLKIKRYTTSSGENKASRTCISNAVIKLALFYALDSGVDADKIERFAYIIKTGMHNGEHEFAATICRNDLISGAINIGRGIEDRKKSLHKVEKAIYDFVNEYPRKISYINHKGAIFSNNKKFKEY